MLQLEAIKPPLGYLGVVKSEDEDKIEKLYEIVLSKAGDSETLKEIVTKLEQTTGPAVYEFDDFVLDFTEYKEKSVAIVLKAARKALLGYCQLALAC